MLTSRTKEGDVYHSRLLGYGEVAKVFPLKRVERGRATLLEAKVIFECGQSCYFHRLLSERGSQANFFDKEERAGD